MRQPEFGALQSKLESFANRTRLRLVGKRVEAVLDRRNSPYISHRTVTFSFAPHLYKMGKLIDRPLLEVGGNELMISFGEVELPAPDEHHSWCSSFIPVELLAELLALAVGHGVLAQQSIKDCAMLWAAWPVRKLLCYCEKCGGPHFSGDAEPRHRADCTTS